MPQVTLFETLTVSNVVVPLDSGTDGYTHGTITVEDAAIRFVLDGTDPEAGAVGHKAEAGDVIELRRASEVRGFRAIRDAGDDALLQVSLGAY